VITPPKPANALINDLSGFPALVELVSAILAIWPEHERYLTTNFAERDEHLMSFSESIAKIVCAIADGKSGGLNQLALDYRFLCQKIVLPEELYFRRHERYRLEKFEDALETVYSNTPFMTRYMDGLLVSDVIWINHCRCMMHYTQTFLPGLNDNAAVLEIGPGHGLLLHLSDGHEHLGSMAAWDISDASLASAAHTLKTLGTARDVTFEKRNIFDTDILSDTHANSFDGVVLSEVLEHLERPGDAIDVLYHICKPEGQIWINVPANSPAPDHLYLVNEISEVVALVRKSGFEIVETLALPTSGTTLENAVKKKLTVNCIVVGKKSA
jgi:2-polyprenyl-3-methyl-5-hydroxy-6-metoxy-1,4-benzoquinol methylase